MKKIFFLALAVCTSFSLLAQTKKKTLSTSRTATQPAQTLKSGDDSVSYAIGLSVANFFKQQNVQHINTALVERAINDVVKKGNTLLNEQQANAVIMACMNKSQMEKNKENAAAAAVNKEAGDAFLAENKTKAGVVALPSGVQYQILTEGNGPKPTATDKVKFHYVGRVLDGTVFDSSVQKGEPLQIRADGVIPGLSEALQLMPTGSKWRIYIPSNLGYGDQGSGPVIKPGSTLIFEVELIEIMK